MIKKECLNFTFFFGLITPIIGLVFSAFLFLAFSFEATIFHWLPWAVFTPSLLLFILFLYREPIKYVIGQNEITVVGLFRSYTFTYRQIEGIVERYDAFSSGDFIYIKSYCCTLSDDIKVPDRFRRIRKCKKTKLLIEKYYSSKFVQY